MAYPDDFIPEIWSARVLDTLDKNLVFPRLLSDDYAGELAQGGDVVRIQKFSNVAAAAYSGTVTYGTPASSTVSLTVNQDYYGARNIDNLDRVQANVDLLNGYADRIAYGLRDQVDTYLASLYASSTLANIVWDVGTTDAWTVVTTAMEQLDAANIPYEGRWLVVRPKGYSNLLRNSNFIASDTDAGAGRVTSGRVGTIAGFDVFISNNLANTTGPYYKYLYGHRMSIQYAIQMLQMQAVVRDAAFATGVRGRIAFGAVAAQPTAFGEITADET